MKSTVSRILASSVILVGALTVGSAAYADTDTVEAPAGFFVPTDAQKYDSPYYRGASEDWSFTHGALANPFTTAELNISAFDVDFDSGEIDNVYAYDDGVAVLLGHLNGASDIYSFTSFTLGSSFANDIATGLKVYVDIDVNQQGWFLTLAKSVITTDGSGLPPADPGSTVPEPASWAMMLAGFGAIGGAMRSRRSKVAVSFG